MVETCSFYSKNIDFLTGEERIVCSYGPDLTASGRTAPFCNRTEPHRNGTVPSRTATAPYRAAPQRYRTEPQPYINPIVLNRTLPYRAATVLLV